MPATRNTTTEPGATTVRPTPRSRRNRRLAIGGAIAATLALTLAGCGDKYAEPFKDAPRSGKDNGAPMDLVRMADGFSNVGSKCDGPNRVYVVYHGDNKYGSLAVVPNDLRCTNK
ncbi:hypothetical protein [Streptomyces sp. NPDC051546]|uniref:hypothetical protein n=1 Tax=Streptomyces sp. NPDC051546 TaxID=3365655 RepID=UPI00378D013D